MPGTPSELRRGRNLNNRASGDLGEEIARRYLSRKGYEIVESNYRTRHGELDLISRHHNTLVIVEVKLRRGTDYGTPLEAVTARKQQAIRLMTEEYLAERAPEFQALRFDVIGILIRSGSARRGGAGGAERVRVAISNSGYKFPTKKVIVNLAPAGLRKEGGAFDLPMALGIMASSGILPPACFEGTGVVGEVSLDGELRGVRGALSMAEAARVGGLVRLVVPEANAREAASAGGVEVYGVRSLRVAAEFLRTDRGVEPAEPWSEEEAGHEEAGEDFADVAGQAYAKRALEVAAAGEHNVLLSGPPGSGKTMLARRITSILPPLSRSERIEVTKVHSAGGEVNGSLLGSRPFRAPHHTISTAGLAGGGSNPRPGEVSLAHLGVLFLDEFPEFGRRTLEALRQPLEDGHVTISRVAATLSYPARVTLVCSMNPCSCGYAGDARRACRCTPGQIERYQGRISGPLIDRMDLFVDVPRLTRDELRGGQTAEPSSEVRERVTTARDAQMERQGSPNCSLSGTKLRVACTLRGDSEALFSRAIDRMGLSGRGHDRVLRVARTVADLSGEKDIAVEHLAEALNYRRSHSGDR